MLVGVWRSLRGTVRLDGATLDQWSSGALGRYIQPAAPPRSLKVAEQGGAS
jgi:hypothetical protein